MVVEVCGQTDLVPARAQVFRGTPFSTRPHMRSEPLAANVAMFHRCAVTALDSQGEQAAAIRVPIAGSPSLVHEGWRGQYARSAQTQVAGPSRVADGRCGLWRMQRAGVAQVYDSYGSLQF